MSPIEMRLEELLDAARANLIETHKLHDLNAAFHAESRTIYIRHGLDHATRICAIAHELGHMYYGHTHSTVQAEREADEWAAIQLLDEESVMQAARECFGVPAAIAAELGVTPKLLSTWAYLYKIGRTRRVEPRTVFI
ncbi:MAG: ImmA/IrrE family metallo-endopeptidase [Corynebacterium sp.]|nr:ImmA/IrrE family metallo-endopeptidase [Corynebacterium sp.]